MCGNTGNYRSPGRDNFCTKIGSQIDGSGRLGFCTLQDVAGNGNRTDLCRSLGGSAGNSYTAGNNAAMGDLYEFDFPNDGAAGWYTSNTCGYNDFHDDHYFGKDGLAGCCNGPCAIAGSGYTCKRQRTMGNPLLCCLRDMNCAVATGGAGAQGSQFNTGPDACFETGAIYSSNDTFNANISNTSVPDVQQGRVCTCPASNRDQTSTTIDVTGQNQTSYYGNTVTGGPFPVAEKPCYQVMTDWCTGTDLVTGKPKTLPDGTYDHTWRNYWLSSATVDANCHVQNNNQSQTFETPCLNYMYKLMFKGTPYQCTAKNANNGFPSVDGYKLAQQFFSTMLTKYINEGGNLAVREDQVGDSQMNNLIWKICNDTPGLCSSALKNMCSTMTANDLIRNVVLQPWCGCYLPPAEYSIYTDLYQINPECTPICNQEGTIPLPSSDGISGKTCNQSTCIIDNVAIELANAKVGGTGQGINFKQMCSNCGANGICNCTIRNLTFIGVNAAIPSIDVSQSCGGNAQCYKEVPNSNGVPSNIPVPCDKNINYNPYDQIDANNAKKVVSATKYQFLAIIGILLAAILLIVLLWFIFSPKQIYTRDTLMYLRPKPTKKNVQIQKAATAAIGTGRLGGLPAPAARNRNDFNPTSIGRSVAPIVPLIPSINSQSPLRGNTLSTTPMTTAGLRSSFSNLESSNIGGNIFGSRPLGASNIQGDDVGSQSVLGNSMTSEDTLSSGIGSVTVF
jgi:hypothetical protein